MKNYSYNPNLNIAITQMGMLDMHAHLSFLGDADSKKAQEEMNFRRACHMLTCFSAGTPKEWHAYEIFHPDILSFGIHPWYADRYRAGDYLNYYRHCTFVGEIGLDRPWCSVPHELQAKQFEKQLQIAADLGKSILLHTKDCEAEIADMIRDFPHPVCVHWYSGSPEDLDAFLKKDCYFTFGPDTALLPEDPRVQKMLAEIPKNRIFVETDGADAVKWALENAGKTPVFDIRLTKKALCASTEVLKQHYQMDSRQFLEQLRENLRSFLGVRHE